MILDSEIYPRSELEEAVALAESLGLELRVERFSILDDQAFSQNPSTRCYICKRGPVPFSRGWLRKRV